MVLRNKIELVDVIVIVLIAVSPYIFYIQYLLPDSELKRYIIEYGNDLDTVLWFYAIKIHLIVLLLIWHFTCQHWWRVSILIPLILEIFKLIGLFNSDADTFDEVDFIISFPVTIPIIFLVILLLNKLRLYSRSRILIDELNEEIESVFCHASSNNKLIIRIIEKDFLNLKANRKQYSKEDYLNKLLKLHNRFNDE